MKKSHLSLLLSSFFIAAYALALNAKEHSKDKAIPNELKAFEATNVNYYLDDEELVIETNGYPNHTSPYWSNTKGRSAIDPRGRRLVTKEAAKNHELFVAPEATSFKKMAPGNIDDFRGSYTLRISTNPEKSNTAYRTGLGPIGIAVSGAVIYNDKEGPNLPLAQAAESLDYTGAHTGPQSYHYHLEPKAWSNDDNKLIGVMADGFFLYGRKCASSDTYPTDLDEAGGHASGTQFNTVEKYHYHIQNELYLNKYYILFPGKYQGKPTQIR